MPAWFATEGFPESVGSWFAIGTIEPESPEAALELSVGLLDEPPPAGWQSAFGAGIEVLSVSYDGVPTDVENGGPSFLHDATGCLIPLRPATN